MPAADGRPLDLATRRLDTAPLHPAFGAEVRGVDLARDLTDALFAAIRAEFNRSSLLLFRNQSLAPAGQENLTARFGTIETHVLSEFTLPDHPAVMVLSNEVADGKPVGGHKIGWHWHTDLTYYPRPCMATMLHAIEIPAEGGDTLFASLTSAYDALPPALRSRVDPMKAIHSYAYMRSIRYPNAAPMRPEQLERVRDMVHPLIRTHPETGRRALYVSEYIIREFEGMTLEDSQALLAELNAFATEDRFVYRHRWQVGDLLIWDNRATMHKATPYDDVRYRRRMHRSMVQGDVPY